jgi:protocatechuate 3,4-dioxygenase beta subunit
MTKYRLLFFLLFLLSLSLLAACGGVTGQPAQSPQTEAVPAAEATQLDAAEQLPAATAVPTQQPTTAPAEEATALPEPTETTEQPPEPETPIPQPTAIEPVEVTFFTPAQQEGPYYTIEKPADRDNDLVLLDGVAALPAGQILTFGGTVYDAVGYPLEGVVVEIWQTDAEGVYLHPGDPGTESRDRNFQFYGEALTGPDGAYEFRTILPGLYEPRPRHIHVKVKRDGQELLTTQFYFAGEVDLQGADALMLIDTQPDVDEAGNPILTGQRDIFLNVSASGS